MKNCENCGGGYFKEPHYCIPDRKPMQVAPSRVGMKRTKPPGGWPYLYKKLPGMSETEAKTWALGEMVKQGRLERIERGSFRSGRTNVRYVISDL